MEWQTDQTDPNSDIAPATLSKYLGIRFVPVQKHQCFYVSFRVNGTANNFSRQVLASPVLIAAKTGENISFDTSHIPASHGELTTVGDILLKDASVTHHDRYLKYLRKEVLPSDMPIFDIKRRFKDPIGNLYPILTVRCGKSVSTRVAELLSTALNGKGTNHEIFISK
jgi:hypothetical protein